MERDAEQSQRPAEADPDGKQAHVFDARVGQQPLDVLLPDHERQGDGHAQQAESDEQGRREPGADAGDRHQMEADQGVERATNETPERSALTGLGA